MCGVKKPRGNRQDCAKRGSFLDYVGHLHIFSKDEGENGDMVRVSKRIVWTVGVPASVTSLAG